MVVMLDLVQPQRRRMQEDLGCRAIHLRTDRSLSILAKRVRLNIASACASAICGQRLPPQACRAELTPAEVARCRLGGKSCGRSRLVSKLRSLGATIACAGRWCALTLARDFPQPTAAERVLTRRAFRSEQEAEMASSPMMHTHEAYRTANVMVEAYGAEHAPVMAARQCVALYQLGDIAGAMVWRGVLDAVQEIVRTERDLGEQVN